MSAIVRSRTPNNGNSERDPLLSAAPSQNNEGRTVGDHDDEEPSAVDEERLIAGPKPEPTKRTPWVISFYVLLMAFGVFLLVVIVKGFEDPSDVDVRYISFFVVGPDSPRSSCMPSLICARL